MSAVGRRIDRYLVEAELDSGGFGTVYRARHTVIGRTVALKLLHPTREASFGVVERFLREARIVAALSSPHIVQVLDAGMTGEHQLFLAMELLEGETLAARIHRTGALPTREALGLARQILAGLAAAHAAGVVHRDLKPANVFIARGPDRRETAKVLDFGISKSRAADGEDVITMTGAVLGTPHYMAPEQLHGARDVDARADLYALAVVLYEMLSAHLPYEATTLEQLIAKRLTEPPTPLATYAPHLPRDLLAIVDRGLARDPDGRWRTAQDLDHALATLEAAPLPATTPPQRMVIPASTPGLSSSLAMAPTYATPGATRPGPGGSSSASGAVLMSSPVARGSAGTSGTGTTTRPLAPGTTTFPVRGLSIGLLLLLLGGAVIVILVLTGLLAGVGAAVMMAGPGAPAATPSAPPPYVPPPAPIGGSAPIVLGGGGADVGAPFAPLPSAPVEPSRPEVDPTELRVWVDHVLGDVDEGALRTVLQHATPAIERCRRDVDDDVLIQVFVNAGGRIPISQPDVNHEHGDDRTARCVANALRDAGPVPPPDGDGIVSVRAHLPARR